MSSSQRREGYVSCSTSLHVEGLFSRVLGSSNAHSPYISVPYSTTLFYRHTMTELVPVLAQNVVVW
jgi:hypothetical protein